MLTSASLLALHAVFRACCRSVLRPSSSFFLASCLSFRLGCRLDVVVAFVALPPRPERFFFYDDASSFPALATMHTRSRRQRLRRSTERVYAPSETLQAARLPRTAFAEHPLGRRLRRHRRRHPRLSRRIVPRGQSAGCARSPSLQRTRWPWRTGTSRTHCITIAQRG